MLTRASSRVGTLEKAEEGDYAGHWRKEAVKKANKTKRFGLDRGGDQFYLRQNQKRLQIPPGVLVGFFVLVRFSFVCMIQTINQYPACVCRSRRAWRLAFIGRPAGRVVVVSAVRPRQKNKERKNTNTPSLDRTHTLHTLRWL